MPAQLSVGFIGAGKMATALAAGFVRAGFVSDHQILASDPSEDSRAEFSKQTRSRTTVSNGEVLKFARVLWLAVKPGQVAEVLSGIKKDMTAEHLVISIAAG